MQTILKPSLLHNAALYADKESISAFAAWLITAVIAAACFRFAREAASVVLLKLYNILIQKNVVGL